MSLDFIGDSEIQMIKLKVPVLVTKQDYGIYEVMLPDLGPVNGGWSSLKWARKCFELMFKAGALCAVTREVHRRLSAKEIMDALKRPPIAVIKITVDKDNGTAKAEEAKG